MLLMPLIPPDFHTQIAASSSNGEERAQSRHVTVLQGRVDALETQASATDCRHNHCGGKESTFANLCGITQQQNMRQTR